MNYFFNIIENLSSLVSSLARWRWMNYVTRIFGLGPVFTRLLKIKVWTLVEDKRKSFLSTPTHLPYPKYGAIYQMAFKIKFLKKHHKS